MSDIDRQMDIDILKLQLDFTTRNQNEIAKAVGKSVSKSTDRVKIFRSINRNAKFFDRSIPEYNDKGKYWVVKKSLENMRRLFIDYPELLPALQSNDVILSMLVDKHINQICTDEWLSDKQVREFKHRLRISATFFRLYIVEEPDKLRKTLETLFSITMRGQEFDLLNRGEVEQEPKPPADFLNRYGFAKYKPSFDDLLIVAFRTCVGADILYNMKCQEEIEFIKKIEHSAAAATAATAVQPLPGT